MNRLDQLLHAGWESVKGLGGVETFRKPANYGKDPHYLGPVYEHDKLTLDEAWQAEFGEKADDATNTNS